MDQPTIKSQWDKFLATVVPKEASTEQVEDTRSAFYAGAAAMFGTLTDITDGADDEEQACCFMAGIHHELQKHLVEVMGRAMAQTISQATGADVHVEVREEQRPPAGEVH